jgi:outer membrane protein OmpA-like peptidoglycan-associated protein
MLPLAVAALVVAADKSPTVEAAPNIYGQTGLVRTTSAETGSGFDLDANGFFFVGNDFVLKGATDVYTGGNLALSAAFLNLVEVSLASRAATNANSLRAPNQFSVGDVYPSLKVGYSFGLVSAGVDVRGLLPTRIDRAGLDLANAGVVTQALVTLDLKKAMDIPVRVNVDGGFAFQGGNQANPKNVKVFEQNPNFYDGADGQLLALTADQWFYHQVLGGLSVEVPLPYAMPFVETWYQTAIEVPGNRGVNKKAYNFAGDAHLIVTPGARLTFGGGLTVDLAVDIGVLGTGNQLAAGFVDGTPPVPTWLARAGLSYTFDPFLRPSSTSSGGASSGPTGQVKGCVVDAAGHPVAGAFVESPALAGARLATDEAGCFLTPPLAPGDVQLTIEKPGFDNVVVASSVDANKTAETSAKLKASAVQAPVVVKGGGTARIVGWVTNKEDETVDAELELWDSSGQKPAGKAIGGAFDLQAAAGSVDVVAKADGYLAQGAALIVENGARARAGIVLKKAPKSRKAVLEKDKIAVSAKVPFEFKKPRLQSTAEYVLDDVLDILLRNPALKIRVDVYAEALGSPEESQKLADERAAAVVDWLAQHGAWPARLSAKGISLPANAPDKERRVDFVVVP